MCLPVLWRGACVSFPSLKAGIGKLSVACRFPAYLPCDTQPTGHWFQLFPRWPTRSQETLKSFLLGRSVYAIFAEPVQVALKDLCLGGLH